MKIPSPLLFILLPFFFIVGSVMGFLTQRSIENVIVDLMAGPRSCIENFIMFFLSCMDLIEHACLWLVYWCINSRRCNHLWKQSFFYIVISVWNGLVFGAIVLRQFSDPPMNHLILLPDTFNHKMRTIWLMLTMVKPFCHFLLFCCGTSIGAYNLFIRRSDEKRNDYEYDDDESDNVDYEELDYGDLERALLA